MIAALAVSVAAVPAVTVNAAVEVALPAVASLVKAAVAVPATRPTNVAKLASCPPAIVAVTTEVPVSPTSEVKSISDVPAAVVTALVPVRRPVPSSLKVTVAPLTGLPKRSVTLAVTNCALPPATEAVAGVTATLRAAVGAIFEVP